MLPFHVEFKSGEPVYTQIIYAVTKAIVSGQLQPGDPFPSVRQLSQDLRVNPNTAAKAVAVLRDSKLLDVRPGVGTVVTEVPAADKRQRKELLNESIERLVVEAKRLSLDEKDVADALRQHWKRLTKEGA